MGLHFMKELNKKIRIAIVLDENDANAHDLILETFLEPEIVEMFTPVVYGSLHMLKQERCVRPILPHRWALVTNSRCLTKAIC